MRGEDVAMNTCPDCGAHWVKRSGIGQTLVAYYSDDPRHQHDDNCRMQTYECANGHFHKLTIINTCPNCDWTGKKECFCDQHPRVTAWPEATAMTREEYLASQR